MKDESLTITREGGPGAFYEKLGFRYTGAVDQGELVMRREL